MRLFALFLATTLCFGTLVPGLSHAQTETQSLLDRMQRMERDITFLQRQIYRGASVDPNAVSSPAGAASSGAVQVQLNQLQEEMRAMRGQLEQAQFAARRVQDDMKQLSQDVEFRLSALEQSQAKQSADTAEETSFSPDDGREAASTEAARYEPETPAKPKPAAAPKDGADDAYNRAFALMNQKRYAEASAAFSSFVRAYPKDTLTPNAYYWLGETHYVRGDFVRAADGFRRGYEAAPKSSKAADNLLKLGLSLANIKRKEESCVVLQQVITKYPTPAHAATRSRAEQARAKLKCA
jgi:tol-pal system protein YbgF